MLVLPVVASKPGMTFDNLKQVYENRPNGTAPCVYNGFYCQLDSQYCSNISRTCVDVFKSNATDADKLQKCWEISHESIFHLGKYDVCLYFLGKQVHQRVLEGGMTLEQFREKLETRKRSESPCVYNGQVCQLDRQYCSPINLTCLDIFLENETETRKLEICEDVNRKNDSDPGPYDVCTYFLGTLKSAQGHVTLNQFRQKWRERNAGEFLCPYTGELCRMKHQYCSHTTGKCQEVFPGNASEKTKKEICSGVFNANASDPGPYEVCTYFLGSIQRQNNQLAKKDIEELREKYEILKNTYLPCMYKDNTCQRESQLCNHTTLECQNFFPQNAKDADKINLCWEILQQDKPEIGQVYFCEQWIKIPESQKDSGKTENHIPTWIIVLVCVGFIILLMAAFMWKVVLYYRKNRNAKRRQNRNEEVGPRGEDIPLQENHLNVAENAAQAQQNPK